MKLPPLKGALAVALAALFVVVLVQNAGVVTLRFLVWEAAVSQVVPLLFALAVGFALGLVAAARLGRRTRRQREAG